MVAPKSIRYQVVVLDEVMASDRSRRLKPSDTYKPRAWQWINVTRVASKSLKKVVDKE